MSSPAEAKAMLYFQIDQEVRHSIYPQLAGKVVWNGKDIYGDAATSIRTPTGNQFTFKSKALVAQGISASTVFKS